MEKISAVYKIVNTVTGDFYVGSSKNVKKRWIQHKCPSCWKRHLNAPLYQDMQKYGVDKFRFQILAPVMEEYLKQVEQEFIEMLKPTYNNYNAKGWDVERIKETNIRCNREYRRSERRRESLRKYQQSTKGKETRYTYTNRLCHYNGETLTFRALYLRLYRAGFPHAVEEAKKYLLNQ